LREHDVTARGADPHAKGKARIRRRRRRSVGRWIAQGLCVLFALVGLLPVLVGSLLRTSFVQRRTADEAQRLLREEAGVEAKFHTSVQPWPLSVIVNDLVIESSDGTGPVIEARQLALRPRFFSLLQGRLNVGDIEVDRPRVRLVFREGALVNLAVRTRSRAEPTAPSSQPPFASVAINGAHFDVAVDGSRFQGAEVDLDVTGGAGPSFDIALRTGRVRIDRVDHMTFTGAGAPEPVDAHHEDVVCALDARVRVEPTNVLVRRVRIQGLADLDPASDTRPSCSLADDDPRRVELELRLVRATLDEEGPRSIGGQARARAPLRIANRFFPFLAMEGWVAVDADGSWRRGQSLPEIRATVDGKGVALGVFRIASDIAATAQIDGGVVRVPRARVGFADGEVEIHDAQVRPLEAGIPVSATKLDLRGLEFPGLMRDLGVTEHTHVRMHFQRGTLSAVRGTIDPLRIDTDLVTQVRDFEVFDAAFDNPARKHVIGVQQAVVRARFAVRPNAVEFQNGRAEFGGSHLNVFTSLGFSNEFRLVVS
jgi:translocation and assembly module TamB